MSTTTTATVVAPATAGSLYLHRAAAPSPLPSPAAPSAANLVAVLNSSSSPAPAAARSSSQLPTFPPRSLPTRETDSEATSSHPVLSLPVAHDHLDALVSRLVAERGISSDLAGERDESAFFAADLSAVYQAVSMWRASAIGDRVELFYAVKCNPSPMVLHLLSLLGTSFDCASSAEIAQVLSLPSAPSPDRIIFANPCKPASFIRAASTSGVEMMTFDNADELHKIKRIYPTAKLVLRILTDDSKSLCRLGLKFGAPLDTCRPLIQLARSLGLNVVGVSFHVGSGCKDKDQFADAVWRAKKVFMIAKEEGYDFTLLDVGGGFERETFAEMSEVVRDALDLYFPKDEGVRVIAEPGRLLVSSAFTLATSIIARRRALESPAASSSSSSSASTSTSQASAAALAEAEGADVMYYLNDGVYGSFNCIMFDHQIVHPYPLTLSHAPTTARPSFPPPPNVHLPVDLPVQLGYTDTERASVWGPTCDSIDCVRQLVDLPRGLEVGDWIAWGEMGAYTVCAASTFNGFERSPTHWTTGGSSPEARAVQTLLTNFAAQQDQ